MSEGVDEVTLHLFVNPASETLVHAFHGNTNEAKRYLAHALSQGLTVRHILVHEGQVRVSEDIMEVTK